VLDESVGEALSGLHRFSPKVIFLGSYPSKNHEQSTKPNYNHSNEKHIEANLWLNEIRGEK
jgi:prephenate dehydratase